MFSALNYIYIYISLLALAQAHRMIHAGRKRRPNGPGNWIGVRSISFLVPWFLVKGLMGYFILISTTDSSTFTHIYSS